MNPKFNVNEVVIVQSPYYPEANGEYEVLEIFTPMQFQLYCKGTFQSENKTFVYRLKDYQVTGKKNPDNKIDCVSEPSLRKKHQPSNLSFNQLMNVLNSPIASPNKEGIK